MLIGVLVEVVSVCAQVDKEETAMKAVKDKIEELNQLVCEPKTCPLSMSFFSWEQACKLFSNDRKNGHCISGLVPAPRQTNVRTQMRNPYLTRLCFVGMTRCVGKCSTGHQTSLEH